MNNFIQKMKSKLKKTFTSGLAALTFASVVTVPAVTTPVLAEDGLDVNTAFAQIIGGDRKDWHYSYNGGQNFDTILTSDDAATFYNIGLDCTAGTIAVVSKAVRNAGGDPYQYFGETRSYLNNAMPAGVASHFTNMELVASGVVSDCNSLLPGDILVYGNAHMSVYAGGGKTIDFTSGGTGSVGYHGYAIHYDYKTSAGSGTASALMTAVYRINLNKTVNISLTKVSANTSITDGLKNAYSLAGAVFGIYSDSSATNQIATITTDANGKGSASVTVKPDVSMLWYKELTAPKGYCLDSTIRPVNVDGTNASITASDMPGNDPFSISLKKNNAMTDGEEPASLEGAQFTIKYYDLDPANDYSADQLNGMNATRTWVIETKNVNNGYRARLNDDFLVAGSSDLYRTIAGVPTIPTGVISVEETKAPNITYTDENGNEQLVYTLNNKTLNSAGNEVLGNNGVVVMKVTSDNTQSSYYLVGGNEYTVSETPKKGGFIMTKVDAETNKQEPQGNGSFTDATYEVINDNDYQVGTTQVSAAGKGEVVWTFNTTDGGYASPIDALQVGHYIIRETDAPEGYLVEGNIEQSLVINENSQTYLTLASNKSFTEQAIRGGFNFQKNDTDTGTYAQGDTNLQATLKLVNTSAHSVWVDSNGDGKFSEDEYYASGATIKLPQTFVTTGTANTADGTFTTTKEGYFETTANALPYGSYKIVEVTAPVGFAMDGDSVTETTFDVTENGKLVDKRFDIKNDVFTGTFDIEKMLTSTNNGMSTTMKPEAGVEFTALLKKTVDEKFGGDYKAAYEAIFGQKPNVDGNPTPDDSETKYDADGNILFTTKEYDVVTTNNSGKAYSRDLAYGEYYIFQSSHADSVIDYEGNVADYDGAIFSVTEEHQPTKHYYVANHHQLYTLKMHKISLQTGETIEFTNAKFKIKDSEGNYVTQKLGNKIYDTFSTTTRKMIVDSEDGKRINVDAGTFVTEQPTDDDAGIAYTALGVEKGTYYITEVQTPDGFTILKDPIEVTVKEASITEKDDEGTNFIETEFADTQITGKLNIKKSVEKWEDSDKTFVNHEDLSGIGFTITAAEDIINPADGSVLVEAGKQAVRLTGDRNNPYETVNEIFVDKDGNASVNGLPLGKYTVTETTTPEGIIPAEAQTVEFTQTKNDVETAEYETTAEFFNKVTKTTFKKTDVAGEEVKGAQMSVVDKATGEVVDSWTSDGTDHNVEGLSLNKTYTLNEDLAPTGTVKASSIDFTVDESGAVAEETMIDKVVSVSKIDMGGEEVEGAEMNVTDEEGNVIEAWTSDGTEHRVTGLEEGKKYILNEVTAPEGYVKATSIPFEVTGADENGVKVDQHIDMTDKKVTLDKTDGNGNEVPGAHITITDEEGNVVDEWTSGDKPHDISNLEEGHEYTWHEDYGTIFGYYYAEDYTFTVTADGIDQNLEMVDKPIDYEINKVDDKGNFVKGVTLELTDVTKDEEGNYVNVDEEGNPAKIELPNNGVTEGKTIKLVNKLMAGHTYALDETEIVAGVYKTNKIEFTVDKYNPASDEPVVIQMTDATTAVSVRKVDESGKPVAGAKMQIIETTTDEEGKVTAAKNDDGTDKVIYEFTSTDDENGTDISDKVEGGSTYILREDEAPFGFDKVEDTTFTVNGQNGVYQILVVKDNHSKEYIKAEKVDSSDTSKKLAGAEVELYNAKTNKLVAKGTTGSDGTVTFAVKWNDDNGGYYIKETKAPQGYKLSSDKWVVSKATEETGFDAEKPVVVEIKNDKEKSLGVSFPLVAGGMMIGAVAGAAFYFLKKKRFANK